MNFIVSSTLLLKQLQSIGGVLSSSNTLPILDNFLFTIAETELTLSASDLETTIISKIPVQSKETGSVAIPAKILLDTLKTFPPDTPIYFNIDNATFAIEISAGDGKYHLGGHNGDEFPKVPVIEIAATLELPSQVLANAINKTIFATGNDDLRPAMAGVLCQISPESVIFVATDAHKLVRYKRLDIKSDVSKSFIMPKKPLIQLKGLLASSDVPVKIEYDEKNAFFSFGTVNLVCRLIDGKYPNYEAVIPKDNPNLLTIDRVSFLNSIKRISIFSNQSTHQVRIKIAGSELTISAEDLDFANSATERLTCQYEGTDVEIGFNARFILDMLNNLDTERVNLEMSLPNRAGLLLPVDLENKSEEILMLIMPVMLNQ